jgi:hypothetical protein
VDDKGLIEADNAVAASKVIHYGDGDSNGEAYCGEAESGTVTDKLDTVTCEACKKELSAEPTELSSSDFGSLVGGLAGGALNGLFQKGGLGEVAAAIREHTAIYAKAVALETEKLAIEREKLEIDRDKLREIRHTAEGVETLIERMFHTVR